MWRSSQHQLAMQHATDKSVLGDFNDASFDRYGVRSRFFRKDGKFLVETDGPDGKLATFKVKYTFGSRSAATISRRVPRRTATGAIACLGQRDRRVKEVNGGFTSIPNEEINHDDVLHWTKLNQNWNFMCAECHSTGVRKTTARQPITSPRLGAEISVGCEACHGQGSKRVDWVRSQKSWWPFAKSEDPRIHRVPLAALANLSLINQSLAVAVDNARSRSVRCRGRPTLHVPLGVWQRSDAFIAEIQRFMHVGIRVGHFGALPMQLRIRTAITR